MNDTAKPRWNQRRFVSVGAFFSGLALPITGLGNHLARHPSGPQAGMGWVLAHVIIGSLFTILATWHVVLNRHALVKYLRDRANRATLLSREALAALALVAGVLVLTITQ